LSGKEIENKIRNEINGNLNRSNAHGVDLRSCLITPKPQTYFLTDLIQTIEGWTVLEETADGNGYKIVYIEKTDSYGLAILSDKDKLIFLGNYGTFLETLEAM
jgi:hypothetical protein